jgi:GTPase SAR1 family protein
LGQALLILGTPGAGKTMLLLELTQDLLNRAKKIASSRSGRLPSVDLGSAAAIAG